MANQNPPFKTEIIIPILLKILFYTVLHLNEWHNFLTCDANKKDQRHLPFSVFFTQNFSLYLNSADFIINVFLKCILWPISTTSILCRLLYFWTMLTTRPSNRIFLLHCVCCCFGFFFLTHNLSYHHNYLFRITIRIILSGFLNSFSGIFSVATHCNTVLAKLSEHAALIFSASFSQILQSLQ